ncbi:hypothetical protein EJ04DRAFT_487941 [Polyplosphaeria fusca]|uniref:Wbp11/ELF5/Saf1 N-terminal domain-containing protein n=1 Tax=Polyplosphaeria fusca TaxID=682080 RepID=A0A9P4R1B9_9PLEO|nr:hypothetical protein EJ04DRAFT_487941 [Polyplosphaeria fusca]
MAKEKNFNPVQAQKKADKQKELKKRKTTLQTQRNEKLARRNPNRIERDIEGLKALSESGDIKPHERQKLAQLEKDLAAVNKARAALGDDAPQFKSERRHDGDGRGGRGRGGILGKRGRDGARRDSYEDSSDTDDDVRGIPMPRDTPPPIPPRKRGPQGESGAPPELKKPQIVYEAAPQIRDLHKEAARFVPTAVAQKMKLAKGQVEGRLLEPEEYDKLEQEGYMKTQKGLDDDQNQQKVDARQQRVDAANPELDEFLAATVNEAAEGAAEEAVKEAEYKMMAAEAESTNRTREAQGRIAERSLHQVEIEEVEDEDL